MSTGAELKAVGGGGGGPGPGPGPSPNASAMQAAYASSLHPTPGPAPVAAPTTTAAAAAGPGSDDDPLARLLRTLAAVATTPSVDKFGATLAMTGAITSLPEAMAVMNFLLPASPAKIVATVNGLPTAQRQQLADDVAALAADANAALPRITIQTALLQWLGRTLGAGLPEAASRELGTTLNHLHILGGMTQPAGSSGSGGGGAGNGTASSGAGGVSVGWKVGVGVLVALVVAMVAVVIWLALRQGQGAGPTAAGSVKAAGGGRARAGVAQTGYGQVGARGGAYDDGIYLGSTLGGGDFGGLGQVGPTGGGNDLSPFPMGSVGSVGSAAAGPMGGRHGHGGVQYDRPFDLRSPGPGMYGAGGGSFGGGGRGAPSFPPLAHHYSHHG
jgi:hypothetical protein